MLILGRGNLRPSALSDSADYLIYLMRVTSVNTIQLPSKFDTSTLSYI